jgi:hypothetical protein
MDVRAPSTLDAVMDRGLTPPASGPIVYPSSFVPPPPVFDYEVPVHFLECNMFDVTGPKLWSAQSETSTTGTFDVVARDYAKSMFKQLEKDGAVRKLK